MKMAPAASGQKPKSFGKSKSDPRSLKRKRDVDNHEKLQKAVADLVIMPTGNLSPGLTLYRTLRQKLRNLQTCHYHRPLQEDSSLPTLKRLQTSNRKLYLLRSKATIFLELQRLEVGRLWHFWYQFWRTCIGKNGPN